jgi:hypothetical protein
VISQFPTGIACADERAAMGHDLLSIPSLRGSMTRFSPSLLPLVAALCAAPPAHAARAVGHINDTGIDYCELPDGTISHDCAGSTQDDASGRDVSHADSANGLLGFKWRKLASDGTLLPDGASSWACIADRVTGLVWEMKTTDGGTHDAGRRYTNLGTGVDGDASALVAASNDEALCGRTDWRLPARAELQGLVDYGRWYPGPAIDTSWFPNSDGYSFWTSTVQATNPDGAHWYVNFQDGWTATLANTYAFGEARVVSGTLVQGDPRYTVRAAGKEVFDSQTGLVWARCSLGQRWDGVHCSGDAQAYLWQQALAEAQKRTHKTGKPWRLPNAKEIASIAFDGHADPAVDPTYFPDTPSELYWSSSPYGGSTFYAWTFYGYDGSVNFEDVREAHFVRLVR